MPLRATKKEFDTVVPSYMSQEREERKYNTDYSSML